ncbi:hypothetical protein HDV06_006198 [Boothiomyces sp. JEL0866]|nr:hypothetical protein HDV06_006198 [Boothiomyces sp. JEL0866]
MISVPAISATLQKQVVEVAKSIYTCSQDKRFGGLFEELSSKIQFITRELENFNSNDNPQIEMKLKRFIDELEEILTWIQDLLKLSVFNRIVRLKNIVSKIKSYEKQLDLHLQTYGNSIDQIMSNLGVFQTNIIENQEAITKIIQQQLLIGYSEPIKQLLDHLQEKSGRCVKTNFHFKNISVDEVEFLDIHPIAVGSHGKVYKVEYEGKICALKQALEGIKQQSAADMIEKEFQLWYDLKPHPNVVPLLGACLNIDKPFLLMPFYQYGDVYNFITKNPNLSVKDRVGFVLDIAYGMNHLHYFKIVHGDIKGDNVMISQTDGKFVCAITDFGLSYLKQSTGTLLTQKRTGAVRWIAPERYKRGSKVTGEFLDIFAFAMTSYQILSGSIPFFEETDDDVVKEWIKEGERPYKPSNIPDSIWDVITSCWAHNPCERPSFAQISLKIQKEYKNISLETKSLFSLLNSKRDEASTVLNSRVSSLTVLQTSNSLYVTPPSSSSSPQDTPPSSSTSFHVTQHSSSTSFQDTQPSSSTALQNTPSPQSTINSSLSNEDWNNQCDSGLFSQTKQSKSRSVEVLKTDSIRVVDDSIFLPTGAYDWNSIVRTHTGRQFNHTHAGSTFPIITYNDQASLTYLASPVLVDRALYFKFTIKMITKNHGDGFAFILKKWAKEASPPVGGSGLGYVGLTDCIAIEFDFNENHLDLNDPKFSHISIMNKLIDGKLSAKHSKGDYERVNLQKEQFLDVVVTFVPKGKTYEIRARVENSGKGLAKQIPNEYFGNNPKNVEFLVGFTGGNGISKGEYNLTKFEIYPLPMRK